MSIRTNLASLNAQGQLSRSNSAVGKAFERLGSGLRINHAADDAAGLAVASSLNAKTRVYTQAIRNANDGISALRISEGAVGQLSQVLTRLKELAVQASNGAMSLTQRRSLDTEAKALTDEYNRIVASADFNNRKLLDGSMSSLAIQLGYGNTQQISFGLGEGLEHSAGTGSFTNGTDTAHGDAYGKDVDLADVDGDGNVDMVVTTDASVVLLKGNGDGTFDSPSELASGLNPNGSAIGDVNGDGHLDIVSNNGLAAVVLLNNGNGTFAAATSYALAAANNSDLTLVDFNGDGFLDLLSGRLSNTARLSLNDGQGGFSTATAYTMFGSGAVDDVAAADLNGDGFMDVVAVNWTNSQIGIRLGQGNGTLGALVNYGDGAGSNGLALADYNHDGIMDIATCSYSDSSVNVRFGNGNGTFGDMTSYSGLGSDTNSVSTCDINGDGYQDILALSYTDGNLYYLQNNGNGTFTQASSINVTGFLPALAAGDLNGDGVTDVAAVSDGDFNIQVVLSTATSVTTIGRLNLTTASEARSSLSLIETMQDRVGTELGQMGAAESRLQSAARTLASVRENYAGAQSRIMSADIADEAARMVAGQIRQQAAAAALAQANQIPQLILKLLNG